MVAPESWYSSPCDQSAEGFILYRNIWYIGIICTVIASIGATFGTILQKLAHNENQQLPVALRASMRFGMLLNSRWLTGFALLVIFPTIFEAVALTFAPQSLVVPLGGLTIILNQIVAPPILNERVSSSDWHATLIIFFGIAVCTVFGVHLQSDINSLNVSSYYDAPLFLVTECIYLVLTFLAILFSNYCKRKRIIPFLDAWIAAAFGAQQNVSFKAVGMLSYAGISGSKSPFYSPVIYVFGFIVVCCATLQLLHLNIGLAKHEAVLFLPLYSGLLIVSSTILGGVFYKEFHCFSLIGRFCFPLGISIVLIGMSMLTRRKPVQECAFVLLEKDGDKLAPEVFRRQGYSNLDVPNKSNSGFFSTTLLPTILKPA